MSKLRLCTIEFKKDLKIQINNAVKTAKSGQLMNVIELGTVDSFGKPHFCGVISEDIINISKVKLNIDNLKKMSASDRIEWFIDGFSNIRIIKIDDSQIIDRIKDNKDKQAPALIINAVELKWSK